MTPEEALTKVVAEWTEVEVPGEQATVAHAVAIALDHYRSGGSVRVACEAARAYVGSWTCHPAHASAGADTWPSLGLAS